MFSFNKVVENVLRIILRILIIAVFFVLVFIPRSIIGVLNYWLLFPLLFMFVAFYLYLQYWVSKKHIKKLIHSEDFFSIPCSIVPKVAENEFNYGRLVVYQDILLMYVKNKGKVSIKWTKNLNELVSLNFQKISTNKPGFILSTEDADFEFSSKIKIEKQKEFIKVLNMVE